MSGLKKSQNNISKKTKNDVKPDIQRSKKIVNIGSKLDEVSKMDISTKTKNEVKPDSQRSKKIVNIGSKLDEVSNMISKVGKMSPEDLLALSSVFSKFGIHIQQQPKICFCAIFRNESKNVYRCLNSVKKIIKYVYISDTGSTDNTIELVKKWGLENDIKTIVETEKFVSFGHNRTISFKRGVKRFPDADYMLLLDADMVLNYGDKWNTAGIIFSSEVYYFKQKNATIIYDNIRMISTKVEATCIGATHEYWDYKIEGSPVRLGEDIFIINDIGDGGHKQNKFKRDLKLLKDEIDDKKTNDRLKGRDYFYLAQTYKCLGEYEKAIECYTKRLTYPTPPEEIYYSNYEIGNCYYSMGPKKYELAISYYNKAWNIRPTRAEALCKIAAYYSLKTSQHHLAVMYSERGKEISMSNDVLFVQFDDYKYKFSYYLSISYYYTGQKEKGKKEMEYLKTMEKELPQFIKQSIKNNEKFYT
uniref:Glycosyl transferase family 2 n=1 Tax=Pithovirus LCPAC001 TaxID=2506585 RepID=A0A481Z2C4_9VIRU|nr:MAG: glycosyl transferase family 2 [Pithovirus LCPAC001]